MKIKSILRKFKANRITYLGATKQEIQDFKKLYKYLLDHKECEIHEWWYRKAIEKVENAQRDYRGKLNGMRILKQNIIN